MIKFFGVRKKIKIFLFGGSVRRNRFGDVDIGIMGEVTDEDATALKERLSESDFPYSVDVINFNTVSEKFKNNVLNNKIIWMKH